MLPRERQWLLRTMEHVQSMDFEPQLDHVSSADADQVHEILAGKGLRCEDKPFQPCLTLRDLGATQAALGLPACANPAARAAMHALVANLIWLAQTTEADWIFYS